MDIKKINDKISVSGQIRPEDVDQLKQLGFTAIINNRPDGEADDQPLSQDIAAAAAAAGMSYHHIPLGRDGVRPDMIAAMRGAIEQSSGPVFGFCRTGTRSTTLWALSQAGRQPADTIIAEAAGAGYDMSHLAAQLNQ